MSTDTHVDALDAARRMAEAGVPIFVAPPIKTGKVGFALPKGWERSKADPAVVDRWKPGWALCAVMGHVVDAIDIDPRNGGSLEALKTALRGDLPTVYGKASTPSGGEHYLVASLDVRKVQDLVPGVDFQAGNSDGVGRGFIFLAPTKRVSKADGSLKEYHWEIDPDLSPLLLDEDSSGAGLRELLTQRLGPTSTAEPFDYDGPSYDELDEAKQKEADEHVNGQLSMWIKRIEEAAAWDLGVREENHYKHRGWYSLIGEFAWAVAKLAACPWTSLTDDDARVAFENILPPHMAEDVPHTWYDGIVLKASEEQVDTPPWVVRGDPADDFSRTAAAWPAVPERFNDAYLCAWMAHKGLEGDWCWASGLGWMRWDGQRWVKTPDETVIEAVRKALLRLSTTVIATGDTDMIKTMSALLMKTRINAIASLMRGVVEVDGSLFDQQNDLLNVGNGIVDLTTGDLLPHDRKYLLSRITHTHYVPGARHEDWDACLTSLDKDVMDWMQVRFGQAATGWPTSDDVLPIGVGGGSNGKSTLLAGLFGALGDHMMLVPDKLLRASPTDHPTELMSLFGARLAVIEETPEAGQLNVQRLKAVLGTPKIMSRGVFKDNMSWTATHSLFLMTNYAPQVRETDHGTWRRLALVRFNKTFAKKDNFRQEMLRGAGGRREAVLAWLVEGAVRWYDNGGVIPDAPAVVERDTRLWRGESDQILAFLEEGHIEFDPEKCIATAELLEIFNKWLGTRGQASWSMNTMATRLSGHPSFRGIEKVQTRILERLSRHPESLNELPQRLWVWNGIKWGESG